MSDDHEVYPNAPLALVVVEIRFSNGASDRPLPMPLQRTIRDALGEEWVISQLDRTAQHRNSWRLYL